MLCARLTMGGELNAGADHSGEEHSRESHAGEQLAGIDLTDVVLREVDFSFADLSNANLTRIQAGAATRFDFANLRNANLTDASLRSSSMYGVDLRGANLTGVGEFRATNPATIYDDTTIFDRFTPEDVGWTLAEPDESPFNFVGRSSEWRYHDRGVDLRDAWRQPDFDDADWKTGLPLFGYGDSDINTELEFGLDSRLKHPTTYFRHAVDIGRKDAIQHLWIDVQRDDGVAVYLNGAEIARENLEPDAAYGDLAISPIGGNGELTRFTFEVDVDLLVDGVNVLAAEVHQATFDSSDLRFELAMYGLQTPLAPADLDGSGYISVDDVDFLNAVLLSGAYNPTFDLNKDGNLNADDRKYWIEVLANTYVGDSNLDGQFDTSDFVQVFRSAQYEDGVDRNSLWADGDWNGDLEFDTSDFVEAFRGGGFEAGPRAALFQVPEPLSNAWFLVLGILFLRGNQVRPLRLFFVALIVAFVGQISVAQTVYDVPDGTVVSVETLPREDVRKLGDGRLDLNGNQFTWHHDLAIESGEVSIDSPFAIGSVLGGTTVGADASLLIATSSLYEPLQLSGGRLFGDRRLDLFSNVFIDQIGRIGTASQLQFHGELQGDGLVDFETGEIHLNTGSEFSGVHQISGGIVSANHSNSLGSADVGTSVTGGELRINQPSAEPITLQSGQVVINAALMAPIHAFGGTVDIRQQQPDLNVRLDGGTILLSQTVDLATVLDPRSTGGGIAFSGGAVAFPENRLDLGALPGGQNLRLGTRQTSTIGPTQSIALHPASDAYQFGAGDGELQIEFPIADAGQRRTGVDHQGIGATRLYGANTYSGQTTIAQGTVYVNSPQSLGVSNGTRQSGTVIRDNGTLFVERNVSIANERIELDGGKINFEAAVNAFSDISIGRNGGTVFVSRGSAQFGPTVSGAGELVLQGNLDFLASPAFLGPITIGPGTVQVTHPNALGDTGRPTTITTAGRLELDGPTNEPLFLEGGTIRFLDEDGTYAGPIVSAGGTIELIRAELEQPLHLTGGTTRIIGARDETYQGGAQGEGNIIIGDFNRMDDANGTRPIANQGELIFNSGSRIPIELFGATQHTGATRIQATVTTASADVFGTPDAPTYIEENGTLTLRTATNEPLVINGGDLRTDFSDRLPNPVLFNDGEIRTEERQFASDIILSNALGAGSRRLFRGGDYRGQISGDGQVVFFGDNNGNVRLAGDNSFTGVATVYQDTVIDHANALGNPEAATIILGGTVTVNVPTDEQFVIGESGRLVANRPLTRVPLVQASLRPGEFNAISLQSPVAFEGTLDIFNTKYELGNDSSIGSVTLMSDESELATATGGSLTINGDIQLRRGRIVGDFQGDFGITKTSMGTARIGRLPNLGSGIQVNKGRLVLEDRRIGAGDIHVTGGQLALGTDRFDDGGTIFLNNYHGPAGSGAIITEDGLIVGNVQLPRDIDVGEIGSTIGIVHSLDYRGSFRGGSLSRTGDEHAVLSIRSGGHDLTGDFNLLSGQTEIREDGQFAELSRINVYANANFYLNNRTEGVKDNRIPDNTDVALLGGEFRSNNSRTQDHSETMGQLHFERGRSVVSAIGGLEREETKMRLHFQSLSIRDGATALFETDDRRTITFENPPPMQNGIIGGWAIHDSFNFAIYGENGIQPLQSFVAINESQPTDNARFNSPTQLSESRTVNSLTGERTLDLQGNRLTIASGGIVGGRIENGEITSESGAIYAVSELAANVVDNGDSPVTLVISQGNLLGNNSHTGGTQINHHVTGNGPNIFPQGSDLFVNGGTFRWDDHGDEPFQFNDLVVRDGAEFTVRSLRLQDTNINLGRGEIEFVTLEGNGTLTKTQPGTGSISGQASSYSGLINVEEGKLLFFPVPGPDTQFRVGPNGTLRTYFNNNRRRTPGNYELAGGTLELGDEWLADGTMEVTAPSMIVAPGRLHTKLVGSAPLTITAFDPNLTFQFGVDAEQFSGPVIVEGGTVEIAHSGGANIPYIEAAPDGTILVARENESAPMRLNGGTLMAINNSSMMAPVTVASPSWLRVADDFVIKESLIFENASQLTITDDGDLNIRGDVVLNGTANLVPLQGPVAINGTIRSASEASVLNLSRVSTNEIVLSPSLHVTNGTSLRVNTAGEAMPIAIERGKSVRGGGTVENGLRILDGGLIAAGENGIGELRIGGDLALGDGSQFQLLVDEAGDGVPPKLIVDGNLLLTADPIAPVSFDISTVHKTLSPANSFTWTIAEASSVIGDVASFEIATTDIFSRPVASEQFALQMSDNRIELVYTASVVDLVGDFDGDQLFGVADVDLLSEQIVAGTHDQAFDLNDDQFVDAADLNVWISDVFGTFAGDANLDGEFNSADLVVVFQKSEYEDGIALNSTWSEGDWNGDGEFSSSDFIAAFSTGAYENGPAPINNVPEPYALSILGLVLMTIIIRNRSINLRCRRAGLK